VATERDLAVRILRPFAGDSLPDALQPDQILAVMGGPMGMADLGAQLLARRHPVGFEPGLP
jgi:hypothetical protein